MEVELDKSDDEFVWMQVTKRKNVQKERQKLYTILIGNAFNKFQ